MGTYLLSEKEKEEIKKWIFTGSFTNVFNKVKINELGNKLLLKNPTYTKQILLQSRNKAVNKKTQFKTLLCLANGDNKTKKMFVKLFPLFITNFDELFLFLSVAQKKNITEIIKNVVTMWIQSQSFEFLQQQLLLCPCKYDWSFKAIIKNFSIKPKSITEKHLFNYADGNKNYFIYQNLSTIKKYENNKNNLPLLSLKSLNNKSSQFIFDNKVAVKKLINKNNPFNSLSIINSFQDEKNRKILLSYLFKRKNKIKDGVKMFIDNDFEFSNTNNINNIVYPFLFNTNNYMFFFKNKFIEKNLNEAVDLAEVNDFSWTSSYKNISIKNFLNKITDSDKYIIFWLNEKKLLLNENSIKELKNKKIIIINTDNKNVKLNKSFNNIYEINFLNENTYLLLNLIIGDYI